jgi:hypothetical protein
MFVRLFQKITFFLIFCFSLISYSQEVEEVLFKVIESGSKYPVAYATVQFKISENGIIADEEGDFRVPYRYKALGDSLLISAIGYETKIFDLQNTKNDVVNIIVMIPKTEQLDEITITTKKKSTDYGPGANAIVKNAIDKIPMNFPIQPFSYISYYRDYQLINKTYYNLTEGIIESFDQGFQTNKLKYYKNRDALYSYILNTKFAKDSMLANSAYNETKEIKDAVMSNALDNELSILNIHDAIRNYDSNSFSFVNVFKDDFIENHDLSRGRIVYLDDEPLYEIHFIANEKASGRTYDSKGTIYISKKDYAIHKFNYSLSKTGDDLPVFEVNIEYKKTDGKMYLNYITFNNNFIIKHKDGFKVTRVNFDSSSKSFYLTFNKELDEKSIKRKSNYKLYFKRQKMIIKGISLDDSKVIKIELANWNPEIIDDSQIQISDFEYKVKNVKDKAGFKINKLTKLNGYQFREMYVQKVNVNKELDESLIFIQKDKPLYRTRVNSDIDIKNFWLNSPLKTTKN